MHEQNKHLQHLSAVLELCDKKKKLLASKQGAVCVEIETPKALRRRGLGRGCLSPSELEGLGKHRNTPLAGYGTKLQRKLNLVYFSHKIWLMLTFFTKTMIENSD